MRTRQRERGGGRDRERDKERRITVSPILVVACRLRTGKGKSDPGWHVKAMCGGGVCGQDCKSCKYANIIKITLFKQ